jgi:hypothetical protein
MKPYNCREAEQYNLNIQVNLAQLVQITNALGFICRNLPEYNERTNLNCDYCDHILLDLTAHMNTATRLTKEHLLGHEH